MKITIFDGNFRRKGEIKVAHIKKGDVLLDLVLSPKSTVRIEIRQPDKFWREPYAVLKWKAREALERHGRLLT